MHLLSSCSQLFNSNCRQSVSSVIYWGILHAAYCEDWYDIAIQPITTESVYYSPVISIHIQSFQRTISMTLTARKNSKIAVTRSCHLVSVQSANIYVYSIHTYPYLLYESLPTWYMQLRTLKIAYTTSGTEFILPTLHGFSAVSFPF